MKFYCPLNLLRASVFNFKHLDILLASIGHPSKNLLSLEFAQSFRFQLRASLYVMRFSRTSKLKVIAVCICHELSFSCTSVSIYYKTQSSILVKVYCRLNLLQASVFNYERVEILQDSTGHLCIKSLSIQFSQSFGSKF